LTQRRGIPKLEGQSTSTLASGGKQIRRSAILPAMVVALASVAPSLPAQATGSVPGLNGCPLYGDLHICSGEVPSWDGTALDVDLTLPAAGGNRHPLIVMLLRQQQARMGIDVRRGREP
jgi:hypothetical protein